MSVHLHFGILTVDPDGPARLLLEGVEVAAGEDRDEIMLTGRTFHPTAEAGFVDVGSWQVWAEPNDDEDPHQSLHVVVALPESPNAATVTQVRWALLDLVDQHCRVADVAVITAATDWSRLHAHAIFHGPHPGDCYLVPDQAHQRHLEDLRLIRKFNDDEEVR